jgi:O-antigen/teichoic acid export membrane protein
MGLASLLTGLVVLGGNILLTRKYLPEACYDYHSVSIASFKTLIVNGMWNSFNSIGNLLNNGLDLLVTDLMLSATEMGQIAIAKNFSSLVSLLTSSMASAFHPTFLRTFSDGDQAKLVEQLKFAMKVSGLPVNIVVAGFIAIGHKFIQLWIPKEDSSLIYLLIVIALIPSIAEGAMYPLYYIYTLTVKNKIPCLVTLAGGLANVLGMYYLLKYTQIGQYAVLITTAVIMSIINYGINPLYMCSCLKISKTTFYPDILINLISVIITTVGLKLAVYVLPEVTNWFEFLYMIVILGGIAFVLQVCILIGPRRIGQKIRN